MCNFGGVIGIVVSVMMFNDWLNFYYLWLNEYVSVGEL